MDSQNQKIFDRVARHLLTQRKQAMKTNHLDITTCAYRGDDGTRCAIGCLITDEEYSPNMEENSIKSLLMDKRYSIAAIGSYYNPELLADLQHLHDCSQVGNWKKKLYDIASDYDLDPSSLGNINYEQASN